MCQGQVVSWLSAEFFAEISRSGTVLSALSRREDSSQASSNAAIKKQVPLWLFQLLTQHLTWKLAGLD